MIEDALFVPHVIIEDFEKTYEQFLRLRGLPDSPVVAVGYYTAALQVVVEYPLPNDEAQKEVIRRLSVAKVTAMNEYLEQVELMFEDTAKSRLKA